MVRRIAARLSDRLIRWSRMRRPRGAPRRRFVVVQIDGVSHRLLEREVRRGRLRTLARLIRQNGFRLEPLPAGLPTSTPAFQARLMYGALADIPGFEFLDKRTGEYRWFAQPWTAAAIEAEHARGRTGIMRGGRTYGCVFGGGAADCVLTFSHLLRPSIGWEAIGLRAMLVPAAILLWVTARLGITTAIEGGRALGAWLRRARARPSGQPLSRRLVLQWLRELFTLGVTTDVYGGAPALYVNFVGYDVVAHALGPEHPAALRELRRIDRSLREIWRAIRRVPEFRYDLFVLSDHGQVASVPFEAVCGGARPTDVILGALGGTAGPTAGRRNAAWAGTLCAAPAGPNVNVYLTDVPGLATEAVIEARHPGAIERLSRHPGIGLVLTRGRDGLVCHYRGRAFRAPLPPGATGCPLFDRPDRDLLVRELDALLAMPSGGDLIVFGHESPHGCVSYLGERGSHAGPSADELYGFIVAPAGAPVEWSRLSGPEDLYPLLAAYGSARADEAPGARLPAEAVGAGGRTRPPRPD